MGNVIPRSFRVIHAVTLVDSSVYPAGTRVIITKDEFGYHEKGPEGKVCRPFVANLRNENFYKFLNVIK